MSGSITGAGSTNVPTAVSSPHGHHHMRSRASDATSGTSGSDTTAGSSASGAPAGASPVSAPITGGTTGPGFPSDMMSVLMNIGSDDDQAAGTATSNGTASPNATTTAAAGSTASATPPDLMQRLQNALQSFGSAAVSGASQAALAGLIV